MKIVIAPDSFKGSLTSVEVCTILNEGLRKFFPDAEIISIPVADGGEGTLDAFNAAKSGNLVYAKATDPWFREINAPYLFYEKSGSGFATAVIESAKVAGFITSALGNDSPDPTRTTTYGLGLLIKDALARGAGKIIVGLGGSCTNDGGCGMAAALGTKFYGSSLPAGGTFIPVGGTLKDIVRIDNIESIRLLGGNKGLFAGKTADIIGMCDVTNHLCGEHGAAYVFGPQKGASREDVQLLDKGLEHLVSQISNAETVNPGSVLFPGTVSAQTLSELPGSGAAGGLGFGIRAFAGGRLESGIDLMLDTVGFYQHLWNTDVVITGEGRFDSQSMNGKVTSGICNRAQAENVPVIILCGVADAAHVTKGAPISVIETGSMDFDSLSPDEIRNQAKINILNTLPRIANLLKQM